MLAKPRIFRHETSDETPVRLQRVNAESAWARTSSAHWQGTLGAAADSSQPAREADLPGPVWPGHGDLSSTGSRGPMGVADPPAPTPGTGRGSPADPCPAVGGDRRGQVPPGAVRFGRGQLPGGRAGHVRDVAPSVSPGSCPPGHGARSPEGHCPFTGVTARSHPGGQQGGQQGATVQVSHWLPPAGCPGHQGGNRPVNGLDSGGGKPGPAGAGRPELPPPGPSWARGGNPANTAFPGGKQGGTPRCSCEACEASPETHMSRAGQAW